jgi:hypothetical protein
MQTAEDGAVGKNKTGKIMTYTSFATGTQLAVDLTVVTLDLYMELEWFVHESLIGSDYYPIITRMKEPSPQTTRRTKWILSSAK